MITLKSISAALGLFVVVQSASAQDNQGIRAELRLLAFTANMETKEIYIQDPAGPADAVGVQTNLKNYLNHQFSAVTLKSRKVIFTSKPDRASLTREGELLGEVTLPPDGDSSILLFLPSNPGVKAKYQILPVPDSKKAFPGGSLRITNMSATPMRLVLEKKTFDFKPGQTGLIENPPVRANGQMGMRAVAFKDDKWTEISSSLWAHPGEARCFMIIFPDPSNGKIRLQGFDDIKPRSAPAPVAVTPS